MERKSLNFVVIHKQSKWSKFKRRLSSWFANDKLGQDPVILPQIIVTSHDDTGIDTQLHRVSQIQ